MAAEAIARSYEDDEREIFMSGADELKHLVVGLGSMGTAELREARSSAVTNLSGAAREIVVSLCDTYIEIGDNPARRAQAAATYIRQIERMEGAYPAPPRSSGGGGRFLTTVFVLSGLYLGAAWAFSLWPFAKAKEVAAGAPSASAAPVAAVMAAAASPVVSVAPVPSAAPAPSADAAKAAGTVFTVKRPHLLLGDEILNLHEAMDRAGKLPENAELRIATTEDYNSMEFAQEVVRRLREDRVIKIKNISVKLYLNRPQKP